MPEIDPINGFIETASGRSFYFDDPVFDIEDIAFHLSNLCRYTGAVNFYSVAEHCVMVSWLAANPLEGLLHDGLEAYINDLSSPLKRRPELAGYRKLEAELWIKFARHFGLAEKMSADTHRADYDAFFIESAVLRKSGGKAAPGYAAHAHLLGKMPVHCWTPAHARHEFLLRFDQLTKRRGIAHG